MSTKKSLRQNAILELLRQTPSMRIKELASHLNVTSETIRRDFDDMTKQGLIERTYGGAILHMPRELGVHVRHHLLIKERQAIAKLAVRELEGAQYLMIGSGATTAQVARHIAAQLSDITVIVHSYGVATELSHNPTIRVIMAPGFFGSTEEANHGAYTTEFLEKYWVDYAIIGASGLTSQGACEALIDAGEVYSKMMSRAVQTLIVADTSKFNLKYPARFAKWKDVDALITDGEPDAEIKTALDQNKTRLLIA